MNIFIWRILWVIMLNGLITVFVIGMLKSETIGSTLKKYASQEEIRFEP